MTSWNNSKFPSLIILIGIPASGKSTKAREWLETPCADIIVSSDDIREEITGNAADVSRDSQVWPIFYSRIREGLAADKSVIADATHLHRAHRLLLKQIAEKFTARVEAHVFDIDLAEALRRNDARERRVPDHVMLSMFANYSRNCSPEELVSEGYDSVVFHDEKGGVSVVY